MAQQINQITSTGYEWIALRDAQYNLASAHPTYKLTFTQQSVINNLVQFYYDAEREPYEEIAQNFTGAFFSLAGQETALLIDRNAMLCYSASLCIQIVASYIRSKGFRVALIEPAFDNVAGILRAENISLLPLPENYLTMIDTFLNSTFTNVEVVWIILPNNPTGMSLSKTEFHALVETCRKHGVMLVVDFCLRFFSEEMIWDQYAILEESGITYATIEDTGKTWSTLDLKVGILNASSDIYPGLYYYYDNHILNVSPAILKLLSALIDDTRVHNFSNTIYRVLSANRKVVEESIKNTILQNHQTKGLMPVAWLQITDNKISSRSLWERFRSVGIYTLPGNNFFWHNQELGSQFVRLALLRDTSLVKVAMERIKEVLLQLNTLG